MTNDELAATVTELAASVSGLVTAVNALSAKMDDKFAGVDNRFESLEKKMDEGFNASKVREEEIRDLAKFGLEARDILRDEMHRRFDEADRKYDEQISLLKDAVTYANRRK